MKEIVIRTLLKITTSFLEFLEIDIKLHWKRTIEINEHETDNH